MSVLTVGEAKLIQNFAMEKITPMLWFDRQAEEAANFYVSVFREGKIVSVTRWPEGSAGEAGSVLTVAFELRGQQFVALNGGPEFKFNEAISLVINCDTQEEIDHFWNALTADGGRESVCGWLKDKFGLSWQVVPRAVWSMMSDPDPEKSGRVLHAVWKMTKLNLRELQEAYRGKV